MWHIVTSETKWRPLHLSGNGTFAMSAVRVCATRRGGEVFKWWAQSGRKHSREHLDQDRPAPFYSERDILHSVSVKQHCTVRRNPHPCIDVSHISFALPSYTLKISKTEASLLFLTSSTKKVKQMQSSGGIVQSLNQ